MSTTALIFDREAVEEVADWSDHVVRLRRSSILWIDIDKPSEDEIRDLVDGLGLDGTSAERLSSDDDQPYFGDFGKHLHVRAFAPSGNGKGRTQLEKIDCVVAERWVVTVHDRSVAVLDEFRELTEGSGEIGRLDGPRDSVVVSFDVLNTRAEQRTNEVVKVLTLGSLLLLPGALIAGIFGMNFKLAVFENNAYFWIVLALMVAVALATVIVARARRWI